MSAHQKKIEVSAPAVALTDEEFLLNLKKKGLRFAGPCEAMTNIFKRLKLEHGDLVSFAQAQADSISALETFRNTSCPMFLFFYNGFLVKMVKGANAPLVENVIKEQLEIEKQGAFHYPVHIDDKTRALFELMGPLETPAQPEPEETKAEVIMEPVAVTTNPESEVVAELPPAVEPIEEYKVPEPLVEQPPEQSPQAESTEDVSAAKKIEFTLAMIKPDCMKPSIIEETLKILRHNRVDVIEMKKIWLTKKQAAELYKESESKDAPVLVLKLAKEDCIQVWRGIIGPKDPKNARLDFPTSLRGLYGTDSLMNSFHGSDGPVSSARELEFIFGTSQEFTQLPNPPETSNSNGLDQKTLAIIKPDAMSHAEEIISRIIRRGLQVQKRDENFLPNERAQEFSVSYLETSAFEQSVRFLTSEPVLCLMIKGEDAIEAWNEMIGPEDPEEAKIVYPMSLRALYGHTGYKNGLHGSASIESAIQELSAIFPHYINKAASMASIFKTPMGSLQASRAGSKAMLIASYRNSLTQLSKAAPVTEHVENLERTLALIKPDVYPIHRDEIMQAITAAGFTVVIEREFNLDRATAEEFYKEHKGKVFFDELTAWMSSSPIYGIVLEKVDAVKAWRGLAGPTNSITARETKPESIRARFGTDGSKNAVHGSDSVESAVREIFVLFGNQVSASAGSALAIPESDAKVADMSNLVSTPNLDVDPAKTHAEDLPETNPEQYQDDAFETPDADAASDEKISEKGPAVTDLNTLDISDNLEKVAMPESNSTDSKNDLRKSIKDGQADQQTASEKVTGSEESPKEDKSADSDKMPAIETHQATAEEGNLLSIQEGEKILNENSKNLQSVNAEALPEDLAEINKQLEEEVSKLIEQNKLELGHEANTENAFSASVLGSKETQPLLKEQIQLADTALETSENSGDHLDDSKIKAETSENQHSDLNNFMESSAEGQEQVALSEVEQSVTRIEEQKNNDQSIDVPPAVKNGNGAVKDPEDAFGEKKELDVVSKVTENNTRLPEITNPDIAEGPINSEIAPDLSEKKVEQTLALIKPDVYPTKKDEIVARIISEGFKIIKEAEIRLSKEQAEEFYKEHAQKEFFKQLTTWMSSSPIYALVLQKESGVKEWRALAGPTNSIKARESLPNSIRAIYGTDGSLNAVHGSDSTDSALREIEVIFGNTDRKPNPPSIPKTDSATPRKTVTPRAISSSATPKKVATTPKQSATPQKIATPGAKFKSPLSQTPKKAGSISSTPTKIASGVTTPSRPVPASGTPRRIGSGKIRSKDSVAASENSKRTSINDAARTSNPSL